LGTQEQLEHSTPPHAFDSENRAAMTVNGYDLKSMIEGCKTKHAWHRAWLRRYEKGGVTDVVYDRQNLISTRLIIWLWVTTASAIQLK